MLILGLLLTACDVNLLDPSSDAIPQAESASVPRDGDEQAAVSAEVPTEVPVTESPPTSGIVDVAAEVEAKAEANEEQAGEPNRLIHEKSPYLLQHAYNPVDWYPWGEEAFAKARAENKPIFLSIGYSTCHWCHVMEAESFEDEEVAALMNAAFVAVKVDREERPDIDGIYMNVAQLMQVRGGWPLNVVMIPDQKPFFVATYIPRETRFQRVGMLEFIPQVQDAWLNRQDEILAYADDVTNALQPSQMSQFVDLSQIRDEDGRLGARLLENTYTQLSQRFDPINDGFGTAPKFPTPHNLLFLLRYWQRTGDAQALTMVETTLQAMRRGGVYDQIGFGFHRYSTDERWLLPHFEKMLYDQAMLAIAYTETYQATADDRYRTVAEEIFTYVLCDMTDPAGGFYSAEDADSEGEEGIFYLWSTAELRALLGDEDNEEGRLLHRYRDGEAVILANVDDYAFLVWGLLELYEATFDLDYLDHAIRLNGELETHFWDEFVGGFYFTPDDGEALITRQKEIYDGAIPSGNSVAMLNLLRIGRITADARYETRAYQLAQAFAGEIASGPSAHTKLMNAIEFGVGPSYEVVIVGEDNSADTVEMLTTLRNLYLPNKVVLLRTSENEVPLRELADYTKYYSMINDQATAYVCQEYICEFPTNDPVEMVALLLDDEE